tara:strand:+ start:24033 stop:28352 length:4320 start_codon:yes stop_codon:yes gene_type:complete
MSRKLRDLVQEPMTDGQTPEVKAEKKRTLRDSITPDLKNGSVGGPVLIGSTGYGKSKWDKGIGLGQLDNINDIRANMQPWQDQLGNMVGQAVVGEIVGGTIEGLGYLLDFEGMANMATGKEKEYTNWLSEIGGKVREEAQDKMAIYEERPGEMNLSDPGYWFKNGVSVASSLSMMLPSMAATKALGFLGKAVSRTAGLAKKSLDVASKMGVQATWMTEGISQAIVSRHIENSMEASGTFKDKKSELLLTINPKTKKTYTEKEATSVASEAAAYNYRHGWAMLAQDIPQYLALGRVFNPVTKKMENALSKAAKSGKTPKWQSGLKAGGGTFISEGAEEGYQYYIAEKGKLLSSLKAGLIDQEEYDMQMEEKMSSDEAKTSMLFGGLGGNLFQFAGKAANEAFKGKNRREVEKNYHDNYKKDLKNRAAMIHSGQVELAKADQTEDEEYREHALNSMMTQSIIEAVNDNKLDEFIEAITAGKDMTQEEISAYEEEYGFEYNKELAQKHTPKVLEAASRIKKMHYRNLNKAENQKLPKNIVGAITMAQFQSEEALTQISKIDKQYEELLDKSTFTARKPSTYINNKTRLEVNRDASRSAVTFNTRKAKEAKNPRLKKQYQEFADEHKENLKEYRKDLAELEKSDLKKRTGAEAKQDRKALDALKDLKSDLVENRKNSMLLDDFVTSNVNEIEFLKSPEHLKEFDKKSQIAQIEYLKDETEVDKAIKSLQENPEYDTDTVGKEEILDNLENRRQEIIAANLAKTKEENLALAKAEADARARAEKNDPKEVDSITNVDVTDGLEDEHAGEEKDFTVVQEKDDAAHTAMLTQRGKTVALLDKPSKPRGEDESLFDKWRHDGTNKIGEKVKLEISTINANSTQSKEAILAFNAAKRSGEPIPQHVYDFLPIIAYIGDGRNIYTFMMAKPKYPGEILDNYNNSIGPERKRIIDALARGEEVITEINYTSGGKLQTEKDENDMPVENTVYDLKQISKAEDVVLTYSDKDGKLRDVGTKEINESYRGKQYQVSDNKAYRGGLFLMINKADGKKFPVRMNFKKNTALQAELIADILIEISVPEAKGQDKNIDMGQTLDTLPAELQGKIREVMQDEIDVLGGNPTMNNLINMFVYVSPRTEKMKSRLFFSGEWLKFGDDQSITPENRNDKENKQSLIDFLQYTKRRQFSLALWNDPDHSKAYREYVLRSGVINTNVVKNEDAFISDTESKNKQGYAYRIQTYIKPISNKAPGEIETLNVSTEEKIIPKPLQKNMNLSAKVGARSDENGRVYYTHFRTVGDSGPIGTGYKTMAEVEARYQEEIDKIKTIAKPQVITNEAGSLVKDKENTDDKSAKQNKKPEIDLSGIKAPDMSGVVKPSLAKDESTKVDTNIAKNVVPSTDRVNPSQNNRTRNVRVNTGKSTASKEKESVVDPNKPADFKKSAPTKIEKNCNE